MRPLQIALFVLGLLALTTQTFRHAYVKWFEPHTSVLDKFNEPVEQDITAAKSLDELVSLYDAAHTKVKAAEQGNEEKTNGREEGRATRREDWSDKMQREPYKSDSKLREAIETWENHQKQICELHFFSACGAGSLLLGLICYLFVNRWLGMVGIIGGFAEIIWWTSPSFRAFGSQIEFDRLLTEKLIFSVMGWLMLTGLWLVYSARCDRKPGA